MNPFEILPRFGQNRPAAAPEGVALTLARAADRAARFVFARLTRAAAAPAIRPAAGGLNQQIAGDPVAQAAHPAAFNAASFSRKKAAKDPAPRASERETAETPAAVAAHPAAFGPGSFSRKKPAKDQTAGQAAAPAAKTPHPAAFGPDSFSRKKGANDNPRRAEAV